MPFDSKVTDTLHSLRSIVNRLHDVEFLRSLADNSDEVLSLGGGSVVSADYTNVSETCRDHWNRTITALNLNEYWALKMLFNIGRSLPTAKVANASSVYCQEKAEFDTRAIAAMSLSNLAVWLLLLASTFRAILGIFAALISVSTAYDVINQLLSHKALNSPKIEPDQSRDESPCEKTPLLIEEKANITKKEKCNSNSENETFQHWLFQVVTSSSHAVDSFFVLSGLLLSYLKLKEMKKGKGINWFMFYFQRFWRLTPVYMMVMMISACLGRYLGDGPRWPKAGFEKDFCRNNWWRNLLYINNLFHNDDQCLKASWYLANDMQFYAISPLMLVPLHHYYPLGVGICVVSLLGSAVAPGVISYVLDLPPTPVGGGGSQQGMADYLTYYYIKPYCRMGPYIVGILVGSLLYKTDCKVKLNKFLNVLLWLVFTALALLVVYGLRNPIAYPDDKLSREVSALYNATHSIIWGGCVAWVIFTCVTGNGGFVNTVLSWSPFISLSRLTYCIYLTHPILISVHTYSRRTQIYLNNTNLIYLFLGHLALSILVAFVTSIAFEVPMMELMNILRRRKQTK
ncbi:nose resistant to fluoxetine protein 6-like [Ostrea edulis]|uniref:nose resistant to fluoxetine protein 6-like n=1 Tax=Ostrea edulis TaxID=37623 RepID=UPI0024AFDDC7|nr:nose resistant to fluoxetine protein 6-like [Ostrea edulis]